MKKKYVRWTLWTVASPFILFLILCVLIYLPPVQNYLVDKAAIYASEATGMQITVGRVSLSFPLNLVVTEVDAASEHRDTLLSVRRLQVNVQLLPLLKKQVEVDGISLQGVTVDSNDLIHGLKLNGTLGELFLSSHGVALDPETAVINKAVLKDTYLSLCLNDTAAADTASGDTTYWKIILQEMDLQNVSFALNMPLDSLSLAASLGEATLRNGLVDLHKSAYALQTFRLKIGNIRYDYGRPAAPEPADSLPAGPDPSHIALTDVGVELDSLLYEGRNMKAVINRFVLKEQSGLEIVSTRGRLESDEKSVRLPSLKMETRDSYLELNALMDWDALELKHGGRISARLMADVGKTDVLRLLGRMDEKFARQYPSEPLHIRTGIDGDMNRLKLTNLFAELPGAVELFAKGELTALSDSLRRGGDITLEAETKDLKFVSSLADGLEIPYGTRLEGKFTMAGSQMGADMLLMQPEARAVAAADTIPMTVHTDSISVADDFKMERAARLFAKYDLSHDRYEADLAVNRFDLHQLLPADSLYTLSTRLKVRGEGFDFFSPHTRFHTEGGIDHFHYGSHHLAGISLSAGLENSKVNAALVVNNGMMDVRTHLDGTLRPSQVSADLNMDVARMDWQALRLMSGRFETSQHIGLHFSSDLRKQYAVEAEMTHIDIVSAKRKARAKDLFAGFSTSGDSTFVFLRAGDLDLSLEGGGSLEYLSGRSDRLMAKLAEQWETKYIDQEALREFLPEVCLKISSGPENPVANYLSMAMGVSYGRLFMDMDSSPTEGLNGEAYLYGLRTDSLVLDTLYLDVQQDMEGINILSGVVNGPKPGQEAFDVTLEGNVGNNNAQLLVQYLNARKEQGVYMGVTADLRRHGIRMKLFPEHPTLVYRPFTVNKNNYIYLADNGRIHANMTMYDEQGTGLSFYTNREDTLARQDMTFELSRINLREFRRILPYMPDVEGWIGAEAHYIDSGASMMVSTDLRVDGFSYEGSPLGNWELGGVYLPGEEEDHHVDAYIRRDGKEIVHLGGIYLPASQGSGSLSAEVAFEHFPLNVANPFVPDRMVELDGDIDGTLSMKGDPAKPLLNGELALDSVTFFMPEMSAMFRLDNEPVQVVDSRLKFKDFDIFTKGKTPFTVNGEVDFSNLERTVVDLKMHAEDYELLNAPRTKRAMIYGKMYVDFNATLRGPVEELVMRGNMNVLGKTDVTYVLKDSPLTVNDRLGDMVTFVNFNDTTSVEDISVRQVSLGGMDIAMTMHIDQAVQARVDLVPDGSNYMLLEGGGDLSFQYTPRGDMLLTGRYSLMSGEMKYQIPIIPLKTFKIRNGSYVEWTGNVMNPRMNIVATERVRASVGEDGKASRMVGFDVGIALSQTLENLGLTFTLSAPEDASVQDQLNAMSVEERGKLAVTMLVTGMYMAEGNATGGFNVNNALNSFLQSEISNIAGKALDINVGMETVDDDGGGKRTDYNFQFAKRFWNNRFRIVVGGKVSTGSTVQQDETFIDNVSIEYRLDNSGTRYVKLFHDKNYESVLEGEIIETGVGIVLRKKMSQLGELFIFKSKKKN
ncbi:translocation/assembly module TamB domain-containing protein [Phocaeicola sp.]|uniref:translocation/assembly module TamB domain-containing protein n=1 Tax=Phocaeicola sp. TaxID=2773926 RepID=UPI0023D21E85|nr:translocation/assembly module TamB domain-containing protein [Phocaeicola sp.]MDE5676235.1 translocation/assembly module TamB [Phocaeicola sp.]